jgi:hypothetical protein
MTPRLGTAQASIQDCLPAPPRQRTPDDRDPEDADVRDGQLDGRPLLDGLHAKSAGHPVELMRERAVRRLPVVKRGKIVGIVSIGDLAVERDSGSALADISAAPPNT